MTSFTQHKSSRASTQDGPRERRIFRNNSQSRVSSQLSERCSNLFGIRDAALGNDIGGFALGTVFDGAHQPFFRPTGTPLLTWGVLNLGHSLFATALAEKNSGCRGVGQDMASDWLATVCAGEESTGTRVALDLIRLSCGLDVLVWLTRLVFCSLRSIPLERRC